MDHSQKGIAALVALFVIIALFIVLGVIILFASTGNKSNPLNEIVENTSSFINKVYRPKNESGKYDKFAKYDLPECGTKEFTRSVVDPEEIDNITPLGTFTPPDHTLPTEHLYINLTDTGKYIDMIEVYSPGEIYITEISRQKGEVSHLGPVEDYAVSFSLCENIHGYIGHIIELNEDLKEQIKLDDCRQYMASGSEFEYCETYLDEAIKLRPGEIIGKVGKPRSRNFDFGLFDTTYTNDFANPVPYNNSRTPHIICPLDFYEEDIKENLYNKLDRTDNTCGTINYDVPGTLAGNWFYKEVDVTNPEQWNKHLVFGYDNENPSHAVISIGGTFSDPGKIQFLPSDDGVINRRFSQVTPDNTIYCYQTEQSPNTNPALQGKVLVKLTDEDRLIIEYNSGECTISESFAKPYTYNR